MRKKVFSLLLCLAMLAGLLSVSALAAGEYPAPKNLRWDENVPGYCTWDSDDLTQIEEDTMYINLQLYQKTGGVWTPMEDCYTSTVRISAEELKKWSDGGSIYVGEILAGGIMMTSPYTQGAEPVGLQLQSGDYYFTVEYVFENGTTTSAKSPVWSYVQPAEKLETPVLSWSGTRLCWSAPTAGGDQIDCYFVSWHDEKETIYFTTPIDADETSFEVLEEISAEELAEGRYFFRVMALSMDMTVIQDSDWSATNPPYVPLEEEPEPAPVEMGFADVDAGAYYAEAVAWAVETGVTNGTGKDTQGNDVFSPAAAVTRGQAVTFLWRAMGHPEPETKTNPFSDVKAGSYYEKAVLWAVEQGITNGTAWDEAKGVVEFSPDATVTRGQLLTFLWRTLGKPGETGAYEGKQWYSDPENWAAQNGLIQGTAEAYATGADCPRCDVVYYLWNAVA